MLDCKYFGSLIKFHTVFFFRPLFCPKMKSSNFVRHVLSGVMRVISNWIYLFMVYFSVVFCNNVLWISFKSNLQANSLIHFVWLRINDSPYILSLRIHLLVSLVPWGSSLETQRQLVVRMWYVRPRDIFGQKSTSRARDPVGNYSYRTSSRSVRNPFPLP